MTAMKTGAGIIVAYLTIIDLGNHDYLSFFTRSLILTGLIGYPTKMTCIGCKDWEMLTGKNAAAIL